MAEFLDYLDSLRKQVPEVERMRVEAKARGDLKTVRNAEQLLAEWAVLISKFTPANDLESPDLQQPHGQTAGAGEAEEAQPIYHGRGDARRLHAALLFEDSLEALKRNVGGLWLAFRDGRTPWYAKAVAALACLFAVSPIDFTPDLIPHVGYLDDPTILVLGTILAAQLVSPMLIAEFRERAASVDHARAVRGSIAIYSTWLAAIVVTMLHVWRPVV